MSAYNFLGTTAFWIINKEIAKKFGLNAALLLSELVSVRNYYKKQGKLDDDGCFYYTEKEIESEIFLSPFLQRQALEQLELNGWVTTIRKGLPARNHFKISDNLIVDFLANCDEIIEEPVVKNLHNIKQEYINNNTQQEISTSLTGSLFDESESKVDQIVNAEKAKRKKVAPKKEKAEPDPVYKPASVILDKWLNQFGMVADRNYFKRQGKALSEFIQYMRDFIKAKESHDPEPEYVLECIQRVFDNYTMWGTKFFIGLREIREINKYKIQIVANVYNGGNVQSQNSMSQQDFDTLKNIPVKV